jgi:hypothetical protein
LGSLEVDEASASNMAGFTDKNGARNPRMFDLERMPRLA